MNCLKARQLEAKLDFEVTRILSIQNAAKEAAQIPWDDALVEVTKVEDSKTALSLILENATTEFTSRASPNVSPKASAALRFWTRFQWESLFSINRIESFSQMTG